jgi:GDPmannose 4,6-dehydratase
MIAGPRKTALVLGSNGQDGSFLVEHLLRRGYHVTGVSRQPKAWPPTSHPALDSACFDLRQPDLLDRLLIEQRPDLIFHVAAVHGRAGTPYEAEWRDMLAINVGVVHQCLEYLRNHRRDAALVYAGSCKIFGPTFPDLVTEQSSISSPCLYSVTKNAALDLIRYYRREHGIRAGVLHLFQHESERRGKEFFVPKLVSTLHQALSDKSFRAEFNTLLFRTDWGSAREYMDIAIDVGEQSPANDVIVATGRTWTGRQLAEELFARHALDYRDHVIERDNSNPLDRPFQVSNKGLACLIGRVPQIGIIEVCDGMLVALRRNGL